MVSAIVLASSMIYNSSLVFSSSGSSASSTSSTSWKINRAFLEVCLTIRQKIMDLQIKFDSMLVTAKAVGDFRLCLRCNSIDAIIVSEQDIKIYTQTTRGVGYGNWKDVEIIGIDARCLPLPRDWHQLCRRFLRML